MASFRFPDQDGRGIASPMATALVQVATSGDAGAVRLNAHTLPERSATCRVLGKAGFAFVGPVVDPDDGPVWRWERRV